MCIIVVKPKGITFPSIETMESCYLYNSDGAGYMYADKNKLHINKGFMDVDGFLDHYLDLVESTDIDIPFVFHFRIGTHGKKRHYSTCHPFPIADNYKILCTKLVNADYGIAHNGIIGTIDFRSKYSDTMEFVKNILHPLYCKNSSIKANHTILQNILGSNNKLAIMDKFGKIETYGDFITDNGILYSNSSYKYFTEEQWPAKKERFIYGTQEYMDNYEKDNIRECLYINRCMNTDLECTNCAEFDHYVKWNF